jgi:hypothetical protein
MGLMKSVLKAVGRAVKYLRTWLFGSPAADFRSKKTRINRIKKLIWKQRAENIITRRLLRQGQKANEYAIRGLLGQYYKGQVIVIETLIGEIRAIRFEVYGRLKELKANVSRNYTGSPDLRAEFIEVKDALYGRIDESKTIEIELKNARELLTHQIRTLLDKNYPDFRNHNKLGGKKQIQSVLNENRVSLVEETQSSDVLELERFRHRVDSQCKTCGGRVPMEYRFCFVCGKGQSKEASKVKFLKRESNGICCPKCFCPIKENWFYCPNCGFELDFYGFKKLLTKKAAFGSPTKSTHRK